MLLNLWTEKSLRDETFTSNRPGYITSFSEALWLLLQIAPTSEEVDEAQHLLETFGSQIEVLYGGNFNNKNYYCKITLLGKRYRSANIHILLHFADSVRHLGTLWAHSAFPFEDSNGWLRDLFRGSRDPPKQVSLNHAI